MISAVVAEACLAADLSWPGPDMQFFSTQEAYVDCANTETAKMKKEMGNTRAILKVDGGEQMTCQLKDSSSLFDPGFCVEV